MWLALFHVPIMEELATLIEMVAAAAIASTALPFLAELLRRARRKPPAKKPLQEEVGEILKALETHSQRATEALGKLQIEVETRTRTVKSIEQQLQQLEQQRSLLELTKEQKAAIEGLLQRPKTTKEILTSTDFWVGRVLPSAFFFLLGVLFSLWLRK